MTNPYRDMCSELVELSAPADSISQLTERLEKLSKLAIRARALLDQQEPKGVTAMTISALLNPAYEITGEEIAEAAQLVDGE